jgi:hypothetical protein
VDGNCRRVVKLKEVWVPDCGPKVILHIWGLALYWSRSHCAGLLVWSWGRGADVCSRPSNSWRPLDTRSRNAWSLPSDIGNPYRGDCRKRHTRIGD